MSASHIANRVQATSGYSAEAWETGSRPTIVIRVDEEREAWAEAAGFWSVHLRKVHGNVPYASEPTDVPEGEEDPDAIAAGIRLALQRLIADD